jgi:hypothetical protein
LDDYRGTVLRSKWRLLKRSWEKTLKSY